MDPKHARSSRTNNYFVSILPNPYATPPYNWHVSYGGGTLSLVYRLLRPRSAIRCPICGETDPAGMSRAKLRSHYLVQHKEYYDWLVRWTLKLFIAYGVLFVGLLFVLFLLGRETGSIVLPFLVLGYVLSGSIAYRLNTHRHKRVLALEWAEKHSPPHT